MHKIGLLTLSQDACQATIKIDGIAKLLFLPVEHNTGQSVFGTNGLFPHQAQNELTLLEMTLALTRLNINQLYQWAQQERWWRKWTKQSRSSLKKNCLVLAVLKTLPWLVAEKRALGCPRHINPLLCGLQSRLPRKEIKGPTHPQCARSHSGPKHHLLQKSKPSLLVLL